MRTAWRDHLVYRQSCLVLDRSNGRAVRDSASLVRHGYGCSRQPRSLWRMHWPSRSAGALSGNCGDGVVASGSAGRKGYLDCLRKLGRTLVLVPDGASDVPVWSVLPSRRGRCVFGSMRVEVRGRSEPTIRVGIARVACNPWVTYRNLWVTFAPCTKSSKVKRFAGGFAGFAIAKHWSGSTSVFAASRSVTWRRKARGRRCSRNAHRLRAWLPRLLHPSGGITYRSSLWRR